MILDGWFIRQVCLVRVPVPLLVLALVLVHLVGGGQVCSALLRCPGEYLVDSKLLLDLCPDAA